MSFPRAFERSGVHGFLLRQQVLLPNRLPRSEYDGLVKAEPRFESSTVFVAPPLVSACACQCQVHRCASAVWAAHMQSSRGRANATTHYRLRVKLTAPWNGA